MSDLIDRDALMNEIVEMGIFDDEHGRTDWEYREGKSRVVELINNAPSVDAVPVVHGRLVREPYEPYRCSICGRYEIDNDEPYCHCGAKIDEKESAHWIPFHSEDDLDPFLDWKYQCSNCFHICYEKRDVCPHCFKPMKFER